MPPASADRQARVVVLSPIAVDALQCREVLTRDGIDAEVCPAATELAAWLSEGVGVLVLAEESLSLPLVGMLQDSLAAQPPWSDLPLLILTGSENAAISPRAVRLPGIERLGNVTLLERPLQIHELVTAVRSAVRARRRQLEVRDLVHEATQGVKARDRFLAMLGHELRNPLAAISFAMNLNRLAAPREDARHDQTIERQVRHLSRLVDDLLDVGRVTSGKVTLRKAPIDLTAAVRRVLQSLAPAAASHRVRFQAPREMLPIEGDGVRVEQILSNVLINALKYTPTGGRVDVEVFADGRWVAVRVADEGTGIAPETLPRIFDLFQQAESTLDRSKGGMGIGLTLAKSLTEMHGGTIEAASEGLGRGSEFLLRFPRATRTIADSPAPAPAPADATPPCRILVIEDNRDIRESLRELLEHAGHHVLVAANGDEAISRATLVAPDVAIIDIGLPGLDGYQIARVLRAKRKREIRLVALTGYGQPEDRQRARAAGFDRHLTKPVNVEALFEVLAALRSTTPAKRKRMRAR